MHRGRHRTEHQSPDPSPLHQRQLFHTHHSYAGLLSKMSLKEWVLSLKQCLKTVCLLQLPHITKEETGLREERWPGQDHSWLGMEPRRAVQVLQAPWSEIHITGDVLSL